MSFRFFAITALISLVCGFAGAGIWSVSGLGDSHIRTYLVSNPDILPQMADAYQQRETASRVASVADEVATPFPGASFGNPKGLVTLVEFTDYACGYCRASQPEVAALVKANPDLRVVVREWPIFQGSDKAAAMALAAAHQGKFAAFHEAMFANGPPSEASIEAAAKQAGLDLEAARKFAASPSAMAELQNNTALARQLGFTGTPSWVIGDQSFEGAIGQEALQSAIDAAKAK